MDEDSEQNLEQSIVIYFRRGFYMKTYLIFFRKDVILPSTLEHHCIIKELNLKRKTVSFLTNELINDVQESIENGGENRGYHNIRQRLIQKGKPYTFNWSCKKIETQTKAKKVH